MPQFMRKTTKSTSPLIERARALGLRPAVYKMPSAQADLADLTEVKEVAEQIVNSVVARKATPEKAEVEDIEPESEAVASGTGRSASDRRLITLNI